MILPKFHQVAVEFVAAFVWRVAREDLIPEERPRIDGKHDVSGDIKEVTTTALRLLEIGREGFSSAPYACRRLERFSRVAARYRITFTSPDGKALVLLFPSGAKLDVPGCSFEIEREAELPPFAGKSGAKRKYPLLTMEIGESFFAPGISRGSLLGGSITLARRKTGFRYATRVEKGGLRVWRIE